MFYTDHLHRILYSTDASVYRELPEGVLIPEDIEEVRTLIADLEALGGALIPRGAGTSLAGQVVGWGIVVETAQKWNRILEINAQERWVRVQPGVVRDELNRQLKPYGLFFAPETSTSNRCTIGGMVGNNACGAHSLVYGSTRDHLLEAKVLLSDGSEALFASLTQEAFIEKTQQPDLEGAIYRFIDRLRQDGVLQEEIEKEYPHPALRRRNTGYALDELLGLCRAKRVGEAVDSLNLCKLLAGSEGTLAFITELKLSLEPLPPKHQALLCVHCERLEEVFQANLIALKYRPVAVELMDQHILERAAENPLQEQNRFFVQGTPAAILVAEVACDTAEECQSRFDELEQALKEAGLGYAYIRVDGANMDRVWNLRKAGLGLLSNVPGSAKPVSVIEDTAVAPELLPAYMEEFGALMQRYGLECVYHAHIGSGELHLRPVLDLKKSNDRTIFKALAGDLALLVKKYRGSLSGEHGDGRLRGPFVPFMYSPKIIQTFRELKTVFDPKGIFNPGKIIDVPPMDEEMRYEQDTLPVPLDTYYDFSAQQGLLSAIEQCNGSGDCLKGRQFEGGMCPTYRATGAEMQSTRARANLLRELITRPYKAKRFAQEEIVAILGPCISCKACKTECPSNVDMSRIKAEVMQAVHDTCGISLRTRCVARFNTIQRIGSIWPAGYNFLLENRLTGALIKKFLGIAPQRALPRLAPKSLRKWIDDYEQVVADFGAQNDPDSLEKRVWLFADEFTNRNDAELGKSAVKLLNRLGYRVEIPKHAESGRAAFSKGMLRRGKKIAMQNLALLDPLVSSERPLIGLEPSCLLTFRDEYIDLLGAPAQALAQNCLLIDEFLVREARAGRLPVLAKGTAPARIILHGHCHQEALAKIETTEEMLRLFLPGVHIERAPAGCCGMAGAFGYEQEHYELSQKMGGQALFPLVNAAPAQTLIIAPGTSCRQQIVQATGRKVLHPVEAIQHISSEICA